MAALEDHKITQEEKKIEVEIINQRIRKKKPILPKEEYLWNIPKCRRKEYLRNKLSLNIFIKIFGRQNDINDYSRFHITVPEPFKFGKSRDHNFRKIFVEQLLDEKAERDKIKKFKSKGVPDFVKENLYEKMLIEEEEKREAKEQQRKEWEEDYRERKENEKLPQYMQDINLDQLKDKWAYKPPPKFKARKVPEACLEDGLYDKLVKYELTIFSGGR